LTIHEEITPNTLYLVRRGLREAEEKKAMAVVIEMRTNGGSVDAMEEIIGLLERAPMKTYTYVDDKGLLGRRLHLPRPRTRFLWRPEA